MSYHRQGHNCSPVPACVCSWYPAFWRALMSLSLCRSAQPRIEITHFKWQFSFFLLVPASCSLKFYCHNAPCYIILQQKRYILLWDVMNTILSNQCTGVKHCTFYWLISSELVQKQRVFNCLIIQHLILITCIRYEKYLCHISTKMYKYSS